MNFKAYLHLLYQEGKNAPRANQGDAGDERGRELSGSYEMCWQLMQVAAKIGRSRNVPHHLKYWV